MLPWRNDIERRLAELEQRKPIPGPPGRDGRPGKDGKNGLPGPPGKDGISPDPATIAQLSAQFISIDVDAIAAKIKQQMDAERQPIYIGAKDGKGNVTMPLQPVYPGDGVYIHIKPPSLNHGRN